MSFRKLLRPLAIVVALGALLWLWFRPRPEHVVLEREAEPRIGTAPAPTPSAYPSPAPATAAEVQQVLDRDFDRTLVVDDRQSPAFAVGDFNGDGSADLAVAARARPDRLGDLSGPFPNWIVRDPRAQRAPNAPPAPVRIEAADHLLAVIHGWEAEGWRSPLARQAFLLKNVLLESLDARDGYIVWAGSSYEWHELPQGAKSPRVAP